MVDAVRGRGPKAGHKTAEQKIRTLIAEIDVYLGTLGGPGADEVQTALSRWKDGPVNVLSPRKTGLPDELATSLRLLNADGYHSLASAIADAAAYLCWTTYDLYPRHEIGEAFATGHSFCSIVGKRCQIEAEGFDLGLFIIKPNTFYRDHRHAAPELYAPLTGPHGWRFAKGDALEWQQAHQPVWNAPYRHHATKTGPNPFLGIFGWTRDTQEAATVIACDDWAMLEGDGLAKALEAS